MTRYNRNHQRFITQEIKKELVPFLASRGVEI